MEKKFLTIMRKWHNPNIEIVVSDGIELNLPLEDFKSILLQELKQALKKEIQKQINSAEFKPLIRNSISSVTWVFTQDAFDTKLSAAMLAVQNVLDNKIEILCGDMIGGMIEGIIKDIVDSVKQESVKIASHL